MPGNTRRRFVKGCATAAMVGGVVAQSSAGSSTDDKDEGNGLPPRPPEAATGWSAYRGGYGNAAAVGADHGFGDGFEFEALEPDWESDAAGLPVVDDGTVYLSSEGTVHALDADDGTLVWRSEDVGATDPPTVAYDTVYVGGSGSVTALDPAIGTVLWQTDLADADTGTADADPDTDATVSPPTVAFGTAYAYCDGRLYALDAETGAVDWTRDSVTVTQGDPWEDQATVERSLAGDPVATDEYVFAIAEAGTLVGFDPLTGEQRVTTDTYYHYLLDLAATDDRVYVRTGSEAVAAYDQATGEREDAWHGPIRRIAVREDVLIFVTRYELVAVDLETGDQRWTVGNYSHTIGAPVIACNTVLVGFGVEGREYENSLVAFDIADGSERWAFSRTGTDQIGERCAVADRTIYVDDGGLTAIRAGDGDEDGDSDPTDRADRRTERNENDGLDESGEVTAEDEEPTESTRTTDDERGANDAALRSDDSGKVTDDTSDDGQRSRSLWRTILTLLR